MDINLYDYLQDTHYFHKRTETIYEWRFYYKTQKGLYLYIFIPKNKSSEVDWFTEANLKLEELPNWFQSLFAKAKSDYERRRSIRIELTEGRE